jgi:hypothetical protein
MAGFYTTILARSITAGRSTLGEAIVPEFGIRTATRRELALIGGVGAGLAAAGGATTTVSKQEATEKKAKSS